MATTTRNRKQQVTVLLALFTLLTLSPAVAQRQWRTPGPDDYKRSMPERTEARMQRYEAEAKEHPPPEGAVLFAGSATIAGWDLERWFPNFTTIKRGFGGSMIDENTTLAPRGILPHKPAVIVLYAGDNDIWLGKSPELTLEHWRQFVRTVREPLPHVQILFISIRPSLARWDWVDKMRQANALIREDIKKDEHLYYVDIDHAMIGPDGMPRADFLSDDLLHLSESGFELWTEIVTPVIKAALGNHEKLVQLDASKR